MRFAAFSAFSVLIRRKFWLYIYIFNCYILATKSFLRGSDDRLCKIKMIGEIHQNFTEASASVGLILATALDEMNELVPPETWPTPQNATWSYSASSPNGHSRKQKALLYGHLHKMSFSSTPIQTLYFYIPLSSQPQLQTPFSLPEGVHLRELPLYLKFRLGTYKPLPQRASGEGARKILSPLSPK